MTEAEWLAARDPTPMLEFLRGKARDRKFWLFSCIEFMKLNRFQPMLRPTIKTIIDIKERLAEGEQTVNLEGCSTFIHATAWQAAWEAHNGFAIGHMKRMPRIVAIIRCIFGNPFRPISLEPSWLTSTVQALATGIYEAKAFDRMPILADALQDAGCDNEDILNHCRQPDGHVKGCWCVDLLLRKS